MFVICKNVVDMWTCSFSAITSKQVPCDHQACAEKTLYFQKNLNNWKNEICTLITTEIFTFAH